MEAQVRRRRNERHAVRAVVTFVTPRAQRRAADCAMLLTIALAACSAQIEPAPRGPQRTITLAAGASAPATQLDNAQALPVAARPPPPPSAASDGCGQDVDIVFVLDITGSMLPFFEKLDQEILAVDAALRRLQPHGSPHWGLVVFSDDVKVVQDGQPFSDVNDIRAAFISWREAAGLGQIADPSEFNGTWIENGLDALYAAATTFQFRPVTTTQRMIVHVTNDTFWDGPPAMKGCDLPPDPNGCPTAGSRYHYDEVVEALRGATAWTSAFVTRTRPFIPVDTAEGFLEDYQGKPSIPVATGGLGFPLEDVLAGTVSLSDSIQAAALKGHCETYPPLL